MSDRTSIAWVIPGGVGTGKDHIGVPVLNDLLERISKDFDLVVFSIAKINQGFVPNGFMLVEVEYPNPASGMLNLLWSVRREHRQRNFVAIHGFWGLPTGLMAVATGKWLGIRSIVSVLGGDAAGIPALHYGRLHKPIHKKLLFWGLRHANIVNALTNYLARNLRDAGFERQVDILPWGVDAEKFRFIAKPVASPIRFLHIANFHPVKDQTTLLKAFSEIARKVNSELTIVGTGTEEAHLKNLIKELDLTNAVRIISPMPYQDLPQVYHRADILLHTSLSEGQCEVVTEAMSCGVIVCGTRVGLMYDLPQACVTVSVGDHRGLADAVLKLLADPTRMNELRRRAHEWTSVHDVEWTANRLKALYL